MQIDIIELQSAIEYITHEIERDGIDTELPVACVAAFEMLGYAVDFTDNTLHLADGPGPSPNDYGKMMSATIAELERQRTSWGAIGESNQAGQYIEPDECWEIPY